MSPRTMIENIMKKCGDVGASDYEIYFETSHESFIKTSRMKLERIAYQIEKGVGVRIFAGKRAGSFYSSDLSPEVLDKQIERTFAITKQLEEDEGVHLPEKSDPVNTDLQIFDPEFESTSMDDKTDLVLKMESDAESYDPRIVTHFNLYQDAVNHIHLVNSKGFDHKYKSTSAVLYCAAVTKSEKVGTRIDSGYSSRFYKDVASSDIGRTAAEKAITLISEDQIEPETMPVLLDPEMACEMIKFYTSAFSAELVQKKQSFLAGKLDQEIFSDKVTLIDDGSILRGIATSPFDAEGNRPSKNIVVSQGLCKSYLYDEKAARRDKVSSTGNSNRASYRFPPNIQPSNFYMEPGSTPPAEIMNNLDRGIFLFSMTNTGGVNIVSGDFSVEARGVLIEKGKRTKALNSLVMSGRLQDILKNVLVVGNDLEWHGRIGSPTFLIDNMVISS